MQPLTTTSFLLTLLFCLHSTTPSPSNDINNLPNCNQTFSCGSLKNVTYPFTGGLRPSHCGPPEFALTCEEDSVTILKDNSLSYRVTHLDQTSQTFRLSRSDFHGDSLCTLEHTNSSLNNSIFVLDPSHETLSLFYTCDKINNSIIASDPMLRNFRFSCDIHGETEEGFYIIYIPYIGYSSLGTIECKTSIQVPVLLSQGQQLLGNTSLVGEVLNEGFDVRYIDPYSADCTRCYKKHPGGYCGFDAQLGKPICICNDRLCPAGKPRNLPLVIGLSTGSAVVIGLFIGCCVFFAVQRKKRKFAAQVKSKGLPVATPPSSKGPASSINLSQTSSFLTSSKSSLEKGSTYFGVRVFSYNELEEATNSFDPSKELGDGGFGTVYHGVLKDGRVVAVKRLFENNMRRAEQFMNEIEILAHIRHKNLVILHGHRHDINLSNMAVNKIQNHALNELVDPLLGFDKNPEVRRMVTSVAELAFRCLQQDREMRPSMEEVLEALKRVEKENYDAGNAEVLDIRDDDVGLLKHAPPPAQLSPDSLPDQFWASSSSTITPNSY
ncbi:hypothetical protein OIU84_028706 [Salix udensis]|uniref:non-specific serine/threonine protein kinase n=1 Tax=Salix udensis TaxID=889485 RepID=A0AAD6KFH7_9ROSI|nr:hypothetical protein OIU84_028706 [Salix udensis]